MKAKLAVGSLLVALIVGAGSVSSHETLTTTVLFDREIVRVLNAHCVMCHSTDGPAFPLSTYEETWLKGRSIRAEVIARHMPPWAAVPGYGDFANDNGLTLREMQFVVSWVEGLGPRNAGRVFLNVQDPDRPRPREIRAERHEGHWQVGTPELTREIAATLPASAGVARVVVDPGLATIRHLRALEYQPGNRRAIRAVFFTVERTGQWLGSWTPWYGFAQLPPDVGHRLPPGSRIVAEIHYRGGGSPATERGTLGLFFTGSVRAAMDADLTIDARIERGSRVRGQAIVRADTYAAALWPELPAGLTGIEVASRSRAGATEVLLFAKDPPAEWPTPYVFKKPVLLRAGTSLVVTGSFADGKTAPLRVRISRYRALGV
jgi:hypothetical protein